MQAFDQTAQAWTNELKLAISEAAEHLSLYQLTIEPDTPFWGLYRAGNALSPYHHNAALNAPRAWPREVQ